MGPLAPYCSSAPASGARTGSSALLPPRICLFWLEGGGGGWHPRRAGPCSSFKQRPSALCLHKAVVPCLSITSEQRCLKQTLSKAKIFYFYSRSHASSGVAEGLQDSRALGLAGQISGQCQAPRPSSCSCEVWRSVSPASRGFRRASAPQVDAGCFFVCFNRLHCLETIRCSALNAEQK